MFLASCLLLLVAVCAGLTGCSSIYHRTWAKLPPQPGDELKMRVEEAQGTERLANQAAEKLRAGLKTGVSVEITQTDFDRLEMLATELQRRVLAAHDVIAQTDTVARLATELERIERRYTSWLLYVEANRQADVSTKTAQLNGLLSDVDKGSASSTR